MDDRTVAALGVLASLAAIGAVAAPYVLLPSAEASGLSTYARYGVVGPWGVVLFALVTTVAFAAGRQRRTDPATAAGATVAVGLVAALVAVEWALAVDPDVVASITTTEWLSVHRWVVAGLTAAIPAVGFAYARVLDLV